MLDGIKTSFSISDLAQLTGVSPHSIRIWERRYQLFNPGRTDGNIRRYDNDDLKKLLNISVLLKEGHKISDLAILSEQQLTIAVHASLSKNKDYQPAINDLKVAMLHFDTAQFEATYNKLVNRLSFYDLFLEILIPFLEEIGSLWQTNSITVAHEHYISNLIRQKLFFQIENLPAPTANRKSQYILFLPLNELHEIGLMFIHYVLRLHGHNSIYLGPQVDIPSLQGVTEQPSRVFITYLTFAPAEEELADFFKDLRSHVMLKSDQLWAVGSRVRGYRKHSSWTNLHLFPTLGEILVKIKI
ncbi:MAG: MerR family transcriptional regulator [Bacteroidota bacterium]|nr:MerR family transcriptional regulator [Bacteroidota bacterium]